MNKIFSITAFTLMQCFSFCCQGKQAEVVYWEHSIRWTNENNFPYYLKLPDVRIVINSIMEDRIKQKFNFESVKIAIEPEYRRINGFGKSKINWPKKAAADIHEIALVSAISRGTTNLSMYWSLVISIREAGKVIYSKEVNHEIVPYSFSFYMNNQRWMEQQEFIHFFQTLLNEALGLQPSLPEAISINSPEMTQKKAGDLVPDNRIISLVLADTIMDKKRNRIYQIKEGNDALETFIYREADYLAATYKESFSSVLVSSLIDKMVNKTELLKIPIPGKYEVRLNTLESSNGEKLVIRHSRGDEAASLKSNSKESPVIAFEVMDLKEPNKTSFSFVYFKALNTNNEQLSKQHFRPSGSFGTLGVTNTHFIRAQTGEKEMELIYPEQDGMLLITNDGKAKGVMPMMNENINSRQFFHLKLAEKNKAVIPSLLELGCGSPLAQQYYIYIDKQQDPDTLRNNILLLIIMMHTIDWPPIDLNEGN